MLSHSLTPGPSPPGRGEFGLPLPLGEACPEHSRRGWGEGKNPYTARSDANTSAGSSWPKADL
jgi:hypothetical protein